LLNKRFTTSDIPIYAIPQKLMRKKNISNIAHTVCTGGLYLLCYWSGELICHLYPTERMDINPWNPDVGVSLILSLLMGFKWTPMLFIGAVSSDVVLRHVSPFSLPTITTGAAEAMIYASAAWIMKNRLKIDLSLQHLRDIFILIAMTMSAAALMSIFYVLTFSYAGVASKDEALSLIFEYWIGDILGIAVIVPPFFIHYASLKNQLWVQQMLSWDVAIQIASMFVVLWVVFFELYPKNIQMFYLLFVPLLWIAVRKGILGTTLLLPLMQIGMISAARRSDMPEIEATRLQFLMLMLSMTGLILGAVIAEREKTSASLVKSEARLRSIIDMAPDGMLITDDNGKIEIANKLFESFCGFSSADVVGQNTANFIDLSNDSLNTESIIRHADGQRIPIEISTATIPTVDGSTSVITVRDIAARKQAEKELRQRRTLTEYSSRASLTEGFAAAMAHELNQPLSAIINYISTCQRMISSVAGIPPRAMEQLAKAAIQATRAGHILKKTYGFFQNSNIERLPVSILELVRTTLVLFEDDASRIGVDIDVEVPENLVANIDHLKIEQVLINLIRNSLDALSNAPSGQERRINIVAKFPNPGIIEVYVYDTGPGVAPEIIDHLFEPFTTTRASGLGLGLSISNSIIQAHGGRLWVENPESTSGAKFCFTFQA